MSRILVLGTGPLLEKGSRVMSGQCLRTWHFCKPLLAAGHEVRLLTVPIPGATDDAADPPWHEREYEGFVYTAMLANSEPRVAPAIHAAIDTFKPHGLVGINAWPAYLLARCGGNLPLWADLNGWTMAEGQVRAAVVGHDKEYAHFWKIEATALMRADRFSTVSGRQRDALFGEFAMAGRLTRHLFREPLVHVVPNAVHPEYVSIERRPGVPDWLGDRLPQNAQICLWSGGFNSWTDVGMIVESIAAAMDQVAELHLVCTGGAVLGHDEETHRQFLAEAGRRLPSGRWHMLGWTEMEKVVALHAAAAVGINIDGFSTETHFGARNRLTNMLGAGVPVVTTRGTEIAEWIERHEAGQVVEPGDSAAFAAALVQVCRDPGRAESRAVAARARAQTDFAATNTLPPLLEWCARPRRSADAPDSPGSEADAERSADSAAPLRHWICLQNRLDVPFSSPPQPSASAPVPLWRRIARKIIGA